MMMKSNKNIKSDRVWRIIIGNINTFPCEEGNSNEIKLGILHKLIAHENTDIVLISEHNKNLHQLREKQTPSHIMKRWWQNTVVRSSQLRSDSLSKTEPGGTMIVTTTRATSHTIANGEDNKLLGRWNYITLRGKGPKHTTIISIYRPQEQQATSQRQLIASIPRRQENPIAANPGEMWFQDLADLIKEKQQAGHEVIIAGDFNDDLNNAKSRVAKFMHRMGLREVMLEKYGEGPATYRRGTKTIDGVYATSEITIDKGKYVSFHNSPGDHRWIIIELDKNVIIDNIREDYQPPILRRATSKIPSVRDNFQRLLEAQVTRYNLPKQVDELYKKVKTAKKMHRTDILAYEKIEERLQRSVKYADKRCRKVRKGRIPYSQEYKNLLGSIIVLRQIKLRWELQGKPNRPRSRTIKRLIRKYQYKGPISFQGVNELNQQIRRAQNEYRAFQPHAREARYSYLFSLANEFDISDGKGKRFHYRRLLREEQIKEHYKILRIKEGKMVKRGVDRIIVGSNSEEEIIYDKQRIEEEIMRTNKKRLLQADDTILRTSRYQELFGEQGDFEKWENLLKKQIQVPEDAEPELKMWFQFITNYQEVAIEFDWTVEEYINSWRKMDENKRTTPGIQIAHIKSLHHASSAASIISRMSLIPLITGYAPKRWRIGIDSMIPKKTADLRPEKLRLILLMDARFNHNNKLIGKKMMEIGEANQLLASEQFGSRKSKSAIEHALNKRLCFDIIRQQNLNAIYIANDAKACYDRILIMVAYLTMRNFGIPQLVAKSSLSCILRMKHYVRTTYGISNEYYGGSTWEKVPHGCGQGNGYGPALWACISSPLLQLLRDRNFGAHFHSYLSKTECHLSGIAFVDDTDLFDAKTGDSDHDSYASAQMAINQWNSTLRITGGALEPTKTFWCSIGQTKWEGKEMTIQDSGEPVPIQRRSEDESFFSLGVWQSPKGREDTQIQHMIQQLEKWKHTTQQRYISRYHARTAVGATIGRTIQYPLPALGLSHGESSKLQRSLNECVLGKMGIARTVPKTLASTPTTMGGFGIPDISLEQLTQHIQMLQQHMHRNTITSNLLRITMENYILESGKLGNIFESPYSTYATSNTWIAAVISQMQRAQIKMTSDIAQLEAWTTQDQGIMDALVAANSPSIVSLNKVRMHLQVVTLADLVAADGLKYDAQLLGGNRCQDNPTPSSNRYEWPRMEEPTNKEKAMWRDTLSKVLNIGTNRSRRDIPRIRWNWHSIKYSNWCYSTQLQTIYEYQQNSRWFRWLPEQNSGRSQRYRFFCKDTIGDRLPDDAAPCSVTRRGEKVTLRVVGHIESELNPQDLATEEWFSPLAGTPEQTIEKTAQDIRAGTCTAFSDGSFKEDGQVTYAFLLGYRKQFKKLSELQLKQYVHGFNAVPSGDSEKSSYRGELAGILAVVATVNKICTQYRITEGKCMLWVDNKGALTAAFGTKQPTPRWTCYDLVSMIRRQLNQSPVTWKTYHVKSHQDDCVPFEELPENAQGNIIADQLATQAHGLSADWPKKLQVGEPWRCCVGSQVFGGNLPRQIRDWCFLPRAKAFWTSSFGMNDAAAHRCTWKIFFRQWATKTRDRRIWWAKFLSNTHPTGKNLLRRNHQGHSKCPCCGNEEDSRHILQCQHDRIRLLFTSIRHRLTAELQGYTDEGMLEGICSVMEAFGRGLLVYNQCWTDSEYQTVLCQFRMGHAPFLAGLWVQGWDHFHTTNTRSGKGKTLQFVILRATQIIQDTVYRMWQVRNEVRHNNTTSVSTQADAKILNERILSALAQRPPAQFMHRADYMYFTRKRKAQLMAMNVAKKKRWVEGAEKIMATYAVEESSQTKRLRSYFQWDPG